MNAIDDGGPAFPQDGYTLDPNSTIEQIEESRGMTLRDWFAGMALQGLTSQKWDDSSVYAEEAYLLADAMLSARERKEST